MSEVRNGMYALRQSNTAKAGAGQFTAKEESKENLEANESRVVAEFTNVGEKDVWLGLGTAAVKEKGIYLPAATETVAAPTRRIDYWLGAIYSISAEGEQKVAYVEV